MSPLAPPSSLVSVAAPAHVRWSSPGNRCRLLTPTTPCLFSTPRHASVRAVPAPATAFKAPDGEPVLAADPSTVAVRATVLFSGKLYLSPSPIKRQCRALCPLGRLPPVLTRQDPLSLPLPCLSFQPWFSSSLSVLLSPSVFFSSLSCCPHEDEVLCSYPLGSTFLSFLVGPTTIKVFSELLRGTQTKEQATFLPYLS